MPNNTRPTWLQSLWASPAGGFVQGLAVDPVLGTIQLGGHLIGLETRALGRPDLDPSSTVDGWVNTAEGSANDALRATGYNPVMREAGRYLGELLPAIVAPEAEAPALERLAGTLYRGVKDGATRPVQADGRDDYWTGKAAKIGNSVQNELGIAALRNWSNPTPGANPGPQVPDPIFRQPIAPSNTDILSLPKQNPAPDMFDLSGGDNSLPDPASLPRLTAPDFIPLPVPENGVSVPRLEYQPDSAPAQTPLDMSRWGLFGGQYASQYGGGAADALPQASGDFMNPDDDWAIG